MPAGMFLRSGPDWHLDAAGVHTFEAFIEERAISACDIDPVPLEVFLDYARWFQAEKKVRVLDTSVTTVSARGEAFSALLDDGHEISADAVVAAPGVGYFRHLPRWAETVSPDFAAHTADVVSFGEMRDARVLIVGGRQSAYEWAALAGDHGAARVDIVHRHEVPRFGRVSWKFVDEHIESTLRIHGWWRSLSPADQMVIDRQFWEVGRLSLEWWLAPRLAGERFVRWPGTHVVEVARQRDETALVTLSGGDQLVVDRIVFATGYRTDLANVPYLADLVPQIGVVDGWPVLDEAFQSTRPGLYFPGFASTRDFGPFFGFTKGCPAAATLIVDDLLRRR